MAVVPRLFVFLIETNGLTFYLKNCIKERPETLEVLVDERPHTFFWFMRCGQTLSPTADDSTDFGATQIRQTYAEHLRYARFKAAFSDDRPGTKQSMAIACPLLGLPRFPFVHALLNLNLKHTCNLPVRTFEDVNTELQANHGRNLTAAHWLQHWPPSWGYRERLGAFMRALSNHYKGDHLLIGLQSPLAELAAPNPAETRILGTGDIIRYTVRGIELLSDEIEIVAVKRFDCPLRSE